MVNVIELMGRVKLTVVTEGDSAKVINTEGKPDIGPHTCPIWRNKRNIPKITTECAKLNVERLIKECGMFTENRIFKYKPFVSYGTTEIMMTALKTGSIDAAVTVCDGAGTLITKNGELVEGIGAEMPGLVYTDPIKKTIKTIQEMGGYVLDEEGARIDQVEGVRKALEMKKELGVDENEKMKIAVSIVKPSDAMELRQLEKVENIDLILMGVHHIGLTPDQRKALYGKLDLMPNCGKKTIFEEITFKYKVGKTIQMYAFTEIGMRLLRDREDAVMQAKESI